MGEQVAKWVESSGRALELRVARTFKRRPGFQGVSPSVAYDDVVSGTQREGDVLAQFRYLEAGAGAAVSVEVAVECKAGRGKPWVGFKGGSWGSNRELGPWVVRSTAFPAAAEKRLLHDLEWEGFFNGTEIASHAASALGDDRHNTVSDAARQALSFARARAARPLNARTDAMGVEAAALVFPVVVSRAALFVCELNAAGEVVLDEVDEFDVMVHVGRAEAFRVYIKSESAAERMADRLSGVSRRLPRHG